MDFSHYPVMFFECIEGLDITEDTSLDKVKVTRVVSGYDAATDTDIYQPLTFGLAKTEPLAAITEPTE